MNRDIFEDLFVLELANNHWGSVERGLKIINDFAQRRPLQQRPRRDQAAVPRRRSLHPPRLPRPHRHPLHQEDARHADVARGLRRRSSTRFAKAGCVTMATPFDEASVDLCEELGVQIIKIASSDLNDWMLIEKIATARKPVIVSTGGSSLKDIDDLVTFFENRNIPLAINHCVSLYPSEDARSRAQPDRLPEATAIPNHTIGFSSHEYRDWTRVDHDRVRQGRADVRAAHRHRRRRHPRFARTARCPSTSTPGSRHSRSARRCAGRPARRGRSARARRSSTSTPSSAASTPRDLPRAMR